MIDLVGADRCELAARGEQCGEMEDAVSAAVCTCWFADCADGAEASADVDAVAEPEEPVC